ncbi:hypothetical protein HPB52_009872 [Rhipicephalus sanguineus]|uniref:Tick transposon n=1 Tax=Rhipicephalus sanguineus TaxID=34632 RepID=A0A9D4PJX6_RHISA|nr:hypothetical protein HPB52_009872 [Rhipicephalus sanguineus]
MHPIYNVERRKCRTKAILKNRGTNEKSLFVDAARYRGRKLSRPGVIGTKGAIALACSVKVRNSEAAEDVAIVLAMLSRSHNRIISDSKPSFGNYTSAWASVEAARIENSKTKHFKNGVITPRYLKFIPAHMGEDKRTEHPP